MGVQWNVNHFVLESIYPGYLLSFRLQFYSSLGHLFLYIWFHIVHRRYCVCSDRPARWVVKTQSFLLSWLSWQPCCRPDDRFDCSLWDEKINENLLFLISSTRTPRRRHTHALAVRCNRSCDRRMVSSMVRLGWPMMWTRPHLIALFGIDY